MNLVEAVSLAIVGLLVVSLARAQAGRTRTLLVRLVLIALAGWIAEDTCIRWYDGYYYAGSWTWWGDRMPVMVAVIWPSVLLSAYGLVISLVGERRWAWLAAAGVVFMDAWLIEPVAVNAGLWTWNVPGLFGVPVVGVVGWGLFAGACLCWFSLVDSARGRRWWWDLVVVPVSTVAVHVGVLASWWGLFRWIQVEIPDEVGVVVVWSVGLTVTAGLWRLRKRASLGSLLPRVPAALFFFVLLGLTLGDRWTLLAYAMGFAPPYWLLFGWAVKNWRNRSVELKGDAKEGVAA